MNHRPLFRLLTGLSAALWLGTSPSSHALTQSLIEEGSVWKYLDTGVNPPSTWKQTTFNDASWQTGTAPLGYGDDLGGGTIVSFGGNAQQKHISYYFRKSFTLPAGAEYAGGGELSFTRVKLTCRRDDGVIIYLNGVEILRNNIDPDLLSVTNTTRAVTPIGGPYEAERIEFLFDPEDFASNLLKENGANNVISAEVHQHSPTSSDIVFDATLSLVTSEPCYGQAKPGIIATFDNDVGGFDTEFFHERPTLDERPFDEQDTEMDWLMTTTGAGIVTANDLTDAVTGNALTSLPLQVVGAPLLSWESEAIDTRGYRKLQARAKVQANRDPNRPTTQWTTADYIVFSLLVSEDGENYTEIPWTAYGNPPPLGQYTDLVGENAGKKAIVPTNDTNPPITGASNWRTLAFNDSAWPSGTAGAGYENSPGSIPDYNTFLDPSFNFLSQLYGKKPTLYIRAVFPPAPSDVATYPQFQLLMRSDDGFVAYLNDSEIARRRAPAGAVTSNSVASGDNPDTTAVQWETVTLSVTGAGNARSKLSTTTQNVLAIHALNASTTSSDMLAWPVLRLGKTVSVPRTPLTQIDDGNLDTYTTIVTPLDANQNNPLIPNGTQSVRIKITANCSENLTKGLYFDDIELIGEPLVATTFDGRMAQVAPNASAEERAADADLDGDTIPNVVEHGFGSDPVVAQLTTTVGGQTVPILPEWRVDNLGFVYVSFRMPATLYAGDPGFGFDVLDINIRPQISFGDFSDAGWNDAVSGVNYFEIDGTPADNGDGTITMTCKTLEPEANRNDTLYVRVRVSLRNPGFLNQEAPYCDF